MEEEAAQAEMELEAQVHREVRVVVEEEDTSTSATKGLPLIMEGSLGQRTFLEV